MRKVEGTATISIEELDRLREREQWYNDLRGKLKNIVGKLDTEEYDKEMKKIDDSPDDISDEDFDRAKAVQERNGKYYKALYDQAGNSIAVPIFESIFRKIILHEVA